MNFAFAPPGSVIYVITNLNDYAVMHWGSIHGYTQGQMRVVREPHILRGRIDITVAILLNDGEIPPGVDAALTLANQMVHDGRATLRTARP